MQHVEAWKLTVKPIETRLVFFTWERKKWNKGPIWLGKVFTYHPNLYWICFKWVMTWGWWYWLNPTLGIQCFVEVPHLTLWPPYPTKTVCYRQLWSLFVGQQLWPNSWCCLFTIVLRLDFVNSLISHQCGKQKSIHTKFYSLIPIDHNQLEFNGSISWYSETIRNRNT